MIEGVHEMTGARVRLLEDLFSPRRRALHYGVAEERDRKLFISTAPEQWSYTVSFPKADSGHAASGRYLVLVDVLVEQGRIGVGVLAPDGSTFLREQEVGAEDGPVTVEFRAYELADCQSLIIRNVQVGGQRSRAVLEAIRVYEGGSVGRSSRASGVATKDCFADLARLAASPRTVVDIGANIGDTVEKCCSAFPEAIVHAIEPTPELLHRLTDRFGEAPRVRVHGLAISDYDGRVAFRRNKNHVTSSILPWAPRAEQFVEGSTAVDSIIDVQCCTLATFCATQKIDRIDILKIDVQGAERLVLGGARELFAAGRIALVLLEASFVPIYADQTEFDEIMNFMRKNDFALFDLYDLRYADSGQIKWGDTLFFKPEGARA